MNAFDRFEQAIPELMDELAPSRVPDYVDDLLLATASHGQRPAWSYPERWLPVDITARPLIARSVPWRLIFVMALIALAIAAGLVALVGSRPAVPAPFGPTGNGLFVYRADDGSIVTLDPDTKAQAVVAPADARLGDPTVSRSGRRIAYGDAGPALAPIVITDIDGSHPTTLAGTYRDVAALNWSPDDSHVAFTSPQADSVAVTVAATDGSSAATLPLHRDVRDLWYLPDGRLVLIAADQPGQHCDRDLGTGSSDCALFLVAADGTGLEPIVRSSAFDGLDLMPSFDGKRLVYVQWTPPDAAGRLHVVDLATKSDTLVPVTDMPVLYNINHAAFSPDGTSILFDFLEIDGDRWGVVPTAGGPPVRLGHKFADGANDADWAPDSRSVLAYYGAAAGAGELWLLDPTGHGADRRLDMSLPALPAWQHVAAGPGA